MTICPFMKSDCTENCALFREGECVFQRVPDVAEKIEELVDELENVTKAIQQMNDRI